MTVFCSEWTWRAGLSQGDTVFNASMRLHPQAVEGSNTPCGVHTAGNIKEEEEEEEEEEEVDNTSLEWTTLKSTIEFTQERNPMDVISGETLFSVVQP